jgi:hypothetical protein
MAIAFCPECEGGVRPEHRLRLGQRCLCPHCCTVIKVISLRPLELDWAYDKDEPEGSRGCVAQEAGASVIYRR